MWNKIYLILLAISIVAMSALSYISADWLTSISDPQSVAANYSFYANISWTFLLISPLILLIAANALLFKTRRSWALWTTFLYFAVFIIIHTFWLGENYFQYKKAKGLADGSFSLGAFVGVMFVALAVILVFFNQYLVKRMQARMFPETKSIEPILRQDLVEKDSI